MEGNLFPLHYSRAHTHNMDQLIQTTLEKHEGSKEQTSLEGTSLINVSNLIRHYSRTHTHTMDQLIQTTLEKHEASKEQAS